MHITSVIFLKIYIDKLLILKHSNIVFSFKNHTNINKTNLRIQKN